LKKNSRIIIALDDMTIPDALRLAEKTGSKVWGFKVNSLYSQNPEVVKMLKPFGKVFVDMKIHDIPKTAALHAEKQLNHGADIINCHVSGGVKMMRYIRTVTNVNHALVIAVTVLTSLDKDDCEDIYGEKNVLRKVMHFAEMALDNAVLDGIVCSPNEVRGIKEEWGDRCITIIPGIRLVGDDTEDQKRLDTPYNAIMNGADLLVIGSSITKAEDPVEAVDIINEQIEKALQEIKR